MIFRHALAALLAASTVVASPVYVYSPTHSFRNVDTHTTYRKRSMGLNWGKDKIRGVNIGGWLVLEP